MGRKMKRDSWAEQVFQVIPANGDPIPADEAAARTGLTRAQVAVAVAHLRDTYPDLPLVSSAKGYLFTTDDEAVSQYSNARAKTAITQTTRTWTGVLRPYYQSLGDPMLLRREERRHKFLVEEMADTIREGVT